MNIVILLTLVAVAFAEEYMPDPQDPYDVDSLPNHPEVIKARVECLLDKQPCDEVTALYKEIQYELVRQECIRCSPHLKHFYNIFLKALKTHHPQDYQEYKQKYDPEGLHFEALEARIANY